MDEHQHPLVIIGASPDERRFAVVPGFDGYRWGPQMTHASADTVLGVRFLPVPELRPMGLEQQRNHSWQVLGELIGTPPMTW